MPAKNHIHTYRRIKGKGETRYGCTDPDCSTQIQEKLLRGKRALCPYCSGEYILTTPMLKLALPHCGCIRGKKQAIEIDPVADLLLQQLERNE